jgi:hypothetical protein
LAWQSYGEPAKQMIARWAPQLSWPLSLLSQLGWSPSAPATKSPSGPERLAEQPSTPAVQASAPDGPQAAPVAPQAAPVSQTVPDTLTAAAPADPSPDLQQLQAMARDLASVQQSIEKLAAGEERMARDLASVQQSVEKLTAGQERMARDIARLQAAEKDIRHRISVPPPPQPPATPARKPMPVTPPPEEAAPQVSTAPPPPAPSAPPPPELRPPMPVR